MKNPRLVQGALLSEQEGGGKGGNVNSVNNLQGDIQIFSSSNKGPAYLEWLNDGGRNGIVLQTEQLNSYLSNLGTNVATLSSAFGEMEKQLQALQKQVDDYVKQQRPNKILMNNIYSTSWKQGDMLEIPTNDIIAFSSYYNYGSVINFAQGSSSYHEAYGVIVDYNTTIAKVYIYWVAP